MLREATGSVDWNAKNVNGWYPLLMAVQADFVDILQIILSVPPPLLDLSVREAEFFTVAQLAVMKNDETEETLRCLRLLSADPRVDWNSRNQTGPLH